MNWKKTMMRLIGNFRFVINHFSQNDILPYNSLKQSDPYASIQEDKKRMSKEGDFSKISHRALQNLEEDLSANEESANDGSTSDLKRRYYEPLKDNKNKGARYKGPNKDILINSNNPSTSRLDRDNSHETYSNPHSQNIDQRNEAKHGSKRVKNPSGPQNYLNKPGTFIESSKPILGTSHSLIPPHDQFNSNGKHRLLIILLPSDLSIFVFLDKKAKRTFLPNFISESYITLSYRT